MAAGIQSATSLTANTWTQVAAGADASNAQVVTISFCNTNSSGVQVALATTTTGSTTIANSLYLEFNVGLNARSVLERTGIVLANGQNLIAWANTANVNVVVTAIEGPQTGGTSGVESRLELGASTWTTAVSAPAAGRIKVCTVNFVNRTGAAINIRLAAALNPGSPVAGEYLEFDYSLPANGGVLERTGIVLNSTRGLGVWAASAGVTAVAWDVDDIAA